MSGFAVSQRNGWLYGLLAVVMLLVALAIVLPIAALIAVGLAVLLLGMLLFHGYQKAAEVAGQVQQKVESAFNPEATPALQPTHILEDGELHHAWLVPLNDAEPVYQFVLTSEGYKIANQDGRVVHEFK
jgi:hypothetical protein